MSRRRICRVCGAELLGASFLIKLLDEARASFPPLSAPNFADLAAEAAGRLYGAGEIVAAQLAGFCGHECRNAKKVRASA